MRLSIYRQDEETAVKTQDRINDLLLHKLKAGVVKAIRYLYGWRNKPGKLLVRALTKIKCRSFIHHTDSGRRTILHSSDVIAGRFPDFIT